VSIVRKRVAILISGRGSNMMRLVEAAAERDFPATIVGVVSDRPDAMGLRYAESKGIATRVVERKSFASKDLHDAAIHKELAALGAEIVCLAGYMRLLTAPFVETWQGRMINIHPALLPAFKGLDTHRRALEEGVRLHGCTVHFVTPEMDDGPIIAQAAVPVLPDDTEEALAARVLKAEHHIYPLALSLVASGKARMEGRRSVFSDGAYTVAADVTLSSIGVLAEEIDVEALARFTP
jgi:formyltetrahydrofolate-dependent phosphoribosylglycinamide formyltransferase